MARINLLPWREELRKERQRNFISGAVAAVAASVFIMILVHLQIGSLINAQKARNTYLEQQIKVVEARIREIEDLEKKKEQLLARMHVIEQLQRHRPEVVHIFDEVVRAVPDGLYLLKMSQQNDSLVLDGRAESNARVSALMRNLDTSDWFHDPVLDVIQVSSVKGSRTRNFTLRVKQTSPMSDGAPK